MVIPLELRIVMNEAKNNIKNKENIIQYIKNTDNKELLEYYLNEILKVSELDFNIIKEILEVLKERIIELSKKENTLNIVRNIINAIKSDDVVPDSEINFLTLFLNNCVSREENGIINEGDVQKEFNSFYNYVKTTGNYINDSIKNIILRKEASINRVYIDNDSGHSNEQVRALSLKNNVQNGHKLTEEESGLSFRDKAAFISTTIVLEGSIVLALILSLISLVKS